MIEDLLRLLSIMFLLISFAQYVLYNKTIIYVWIEMTLIKPPSCSRDLRCKSLKDTVDEIGTFWLPATFAGGKLPQFLILFL